MKPDKRLGQHFLRDASVLEEIAALADVTQSVGVLEIGPGEGALTAFLVRSKRPVVAIDRDPRAAVALSERLGQAVTFVLGDALDVDLEAHLPYASGDQLPVVVGNLPYNVGTAIYRRLLGLRGKVSRMVLMLQKEVAHRICAAPGSRTYGMLSVVTALSARAMLVRDVPPGAFFPPPKVTSSLIYVDFPEGLPLAPHEHKEFSNFVGRFFQMRRKKLSRVIRDPSICSQFGIDPDHRPEVLAPETYLALFRSGFTHDSPGES
jgi:16S rRNA (adenine1518-N6/adenine1519-N6)-dimethyltransferase